MNWALKSQCFFCCFLFYIWWLYAFKKTDYLLLPVSVKRVARKDSISPDIPVCLQCQSALITILLIFQELFLPNGTENTAEWTEMQLCDMIKTMINPHQLFQTERDQRMEKDWGSHWVFPTQRIASFRGLTLAWVSSECQGIWGFRR